jgi:hypothetical protein
VSVRAYWRKDLAYRVTPKSGPMRSMQTLLEANEALIRDLPAGWLHREHWRDAAQLLVKAAKTGDDADIHQATEELVRAIEAEGWMTRATPS